MNDVRFDTEPGVLAVSKGGDAIPSIVVSSNNWEQVSPRFPLNSRPCLVELAGGGGVCNSLAVGARLERMEYVRCILEKDEDFNFVVVWR
jgi:hypothetical protein